MKDKPRMPGKPGVHLGVIVGRVIIKNNMDYRSDRDVGLDRIEKADEFLMAVALHAAADDLAFQHIERG